MNIDKIYEMLSWNTDVETQQKGIEEAKRIKSLWVFILPILPKGSKDIWENCAKVLASKTDSELRPYFYHLLTWLRDMNWPGASVIYKRLSVISEESFKTTFLTCMKSAAKNGDVPWECALIALEKEIDSINTGDGSVCC